MGWLDRRVQELPEEEDGSSWRRLETFSLRFIMPACSFFQGTENRSAPSRCGFSIAIVGRRNYGNGIDGSTRDTSTGTVWPGYFSAKIEADGIFDDDDYDDARARQLESVCAQTSQPTLPLYLYSKPPLITHRYLITRYTHIHFFFTAPLLSISTDRDYCVYMW